MKYYKQYIERCTPACPYSGDHTSDTRIYGYCTLARRFIYITEDVVGKLFPDWCPLEEEL